MGGRWQWRGKRESELSVTIKVQKTAISGLESPGQMSGVRQCDFQNKGYKKFAGQFRCCVYVESCPLSPFDSPPFHGRSAVAISPPAGWPLAQNTHLNIDTNQEEYAYLLRETQVSNRWMDFFVANSYKKCIILFFYI